MSAVLEWLRANGHNTSALTAQDMRAIDAIAACWELHQGGDVDGKTAALDAVNRLIGALQRKFWPMARDLIAMSADWGIRDRLWKFVVEAEPCAAGEGGSEVQTQPGKAVRE